MIKTLFGTQEFFPIRVVDELIPVKNLGDKHITDGSIIRYWSNSERDRALCFVYSSCLFFPLGMFILVSTRH